MTTRRVAGVLGILSLALIIAGNLLTALPDAPDIGAPAADYARWLSEHPPGTSFWAGAYLEVLGFVGFLFFFPALWGVLRRAQGEWDWLAVAALGIGLVATAVKLSSGPIAAVVYDRAPGDLTADTQAALLESNDWSFVLTFALDGAFLLAAGALILLTGVLPKWLGWTALPFGVIGLLSVLGGLEGPPAILLYFLWIVLVSVVLIRPVRRVPA